MESSPSVGKFLNRFTNTPFVALKILAVALLMDITRRIKAMLIFQKREYRTLVILGFGVFIVLCNNQQRANAAEMKSDTKSFHAQPSIGFMEGFKKGGMQTYRTYGHKKSHGLNIKFIYPLNWTRRESENPNVTQTFDNSSSEGNVMLSLVITDMIKTIESSGIQLSSEGIAHVQAKLHESSFIEGMASEEVISRHAKNMNMDNLRDIRVKTTSIDGWPCLVYEWTGEFADELGVFPMHVKLYSIVYKYFMVELQMNTVRNVETEEDFLMNIQKYSRLLDLIASSLEIEDEH